MLVIFRAFSSLQNLAASKLACIVFFCSSAQYFYHTWDAYHWTADRIMLMKGHTKYEERY